MKGRSERMDVIDHSFDVSKVGSNERWAKRQREKLKKRRLKKKEQELVKLYEQERKLEVGTEENSVQDEKSVCKGQLIFRCKRESSQGQEVKKESER